MFWKTYTQTAPYSPAKRRRIVGFDADSGTEQDTTQTHTVLLLHQHSRPRLTETQQRLGDITWLLHSDQPHTQHTVTGWKLQANHAEDDPPKRNVNHHGKTSIKNETPGTHRASCRYCTALLKWHMTMNTDAKQNHVVHATDSFWINPDIYAFVGGPVRYGYHLFKSF